MQAWLESFKPRASRRVQLLLAGALWSTVGLGLLTAGLRWILATGPTVQNLLLIAAAAAAGALKSRFVLDRTASKIVERIASRGEGRCLGGFLSLRSWLLVATMIALGRVLRRSVPLHAAGVLYVAIGVGLFLSSRLAWQRWRSPEAP